MNPLTQDRRSFDRPEYQPKADAFAHVSVSRTMKLLANSRSFSGRDDGSVSRGSLIGHSQMADGATSWRRHLKSDVDLLSLTLKTENSLDGLGLHGDVCHLMKSRCPGETALKTGCFLHTD